MKLTQGQSVAVDCLLDYLSSRQKNSLMLLKGYAGTGKTTLVGILVNLFQKIGVEVVLLSPTGRAAKVMSHYAHHPAYTIHKEIYYVERNTLGNRLTVKKNKHRKAIFFVDEASMIYDEQYSQSQSSFEHHSLLEDLFQYVESGDNCFLILIGDHAQLPPVGMDYSPAIEKDYLKARFGKTIFEVELTEVLRQTEESGILKNATEIRHAIQNNQFEEYNFAEHQTKDVEVLNAVDIMEELQTAYAHYSGEGVVCITKSNKQANLLNATIRNRILFFEQQLDAGDYVMSVKNNYFWLPENSSTPFIANGDIMEIMSVRNMEEVYGFHFADIYLRLADYDCDIVDAKVLLDTLYAEEAAINEESSQELFANIEADYMHITNKKERLAAIKKDPYYNALQIKFAYAQTCHKTQGGQWDKVFLLPWKNSEQTKSLMYYRWLYTAVTRAKEHIYISE